MKIISLLCSYFILLNLLPVTPDLSKNENIQDSWYLLADVTIEKRWDDIMQEVRDFPKFGDRLSDSAGKIIELNGYMVPLDDLTGQQHFVLS